MFSQKLRQVPKGLLGGQITFSFFTVAVLSAICTILKHVPFVVCQHNCDGVTLTWQYRIIPATQRSRLRSLTSLSQRLHIALELTRYLRHTATHLFSTASWPTAWRAKHVSCEVEHSESLSSRKNENSKGISGFDFGIAKSFRLSTILSRMAREDLLNFWTFSGKLL